jgi:ubiquinone/menaquinone biosynthesis C-methylase UbiE
LSVENNPSPDWSSYWLAFSQGTTPSTTLLDPDFLDTIRDTDSILDLGCGYGRNTVSLGERAHAVEGVDINEREVAFATQHNTAKNIHYSVMSGTKLEFRRGRFDKVVLGGVLGGVSLEMRHQILAEVRRVLKPHGSIYVGEYAIKLDAPYSEELYRHGEEVTGEYGAVAVYDTFGIGKEVRFIGKHFESQELVGLLKTHGFDKPIIHTSSVAKKTLFDKEDENIYVSNLICVWARKE